MITVYTACILYNIHYTVYSIHCTVYTIYRILYTAYIVQYTVYSLHCGCSIMYIIHYTICTPYTVHCTLFAYDTIHRTPYKRTIPQHTVSTGQRDDVIKWPTSHCRYPGLLLLSRHAKHCPVTMNTGLFTLIKVIKCHASVIQHN